MQTHVGYFKVTPLCVVRFNLGGVKYRGRGHRVVNLESKAIIPGTGSLTGRGNKLTPLSVLTL